MANLLAGGGHSCAKLPRRVLRDCAHGLLDRVPRADLGIAAPVVAAALADEAVLLDGTPVIDYTHFSLTMSRSRRRARWVAWNIDGADFEIADSISRDGVDFRPDPRLPADVQTLEDVYADNPLDRGHLARRADLL